jgi:hypothetical protein
VYIYGVVKDREIVFMTSRKGVLGRWLVSRGVRNSGDYCIYRIRSDWGELVERMDDGWVDGMLDE